MTVIPRFAGIVASLLSSIGLLICIAAIFGAWAGKSRLDPTVAAVFGAADDALGFVAAKLDRTRQALDKCQQRVNGLSRIAERLKRADANVVKECAPLVQAMDEIADELKSTESWLASSHTVATSVSRLSESLVSSEYAATHQDSIGVAMADEVQKFSESVADALAKLKVIGGELRQLRDRGTLTHEIAIAMITLVADLGGKLASLSSRMGAMREKVTGTRASCVALRDRVHWWTMTAAVALTVVLIWFGISQVRMMRSGWRFAHFAPAMFIASESRK